MVNLVTKALRDLPKPAESAPSAPAVPAPDQSKPAADRSAAPALPFVAPQCVTGDTLLRRRKRRKKRRSDDEWEDVPIKDIKEGDEILTMDETSGRLVPSRVARLLPKGEQEIYQLQTLLGRRIRTTSTHPYYSAVGKTPAKRKIAVFVDDANLFYAQRRAGWRVSWKKLLRILSASGDVVYAGYYIGTPEGNLKRRQYPIMPIVLMKDTRVTKPLKKIVTNGKTGAFIYNAT